MGPDGGGGILYFLRDGEYIPAFTAVTGLKAKGGGGKQEQERKKLLYTHPATFRRTQYADKPHWWSRTRIRLGKWERVSDSVNFENLVPWYKVIVGGLRFRYRGKEWFCDDVGNRLAKEFVDCEERSASPVDRNEWLAQALNALNAVEWTT